LLPPDALVGEGYNLNGLSHQVAPSHCASLRAWACENDLVDKSTILIHPFYFTKTTQLSCLSRFTLHGQLICKINASVRIRDDASVVTGIVARDRF